MFTMLPHRPVSPVGQRIGYRLFSSFANSFFVVKKQPFGIWQIPFGHAVFFCGSHRYNGFFVSSLGQKPEQRMPSSVICIVFFPVCSQTMPPCCVITAFDVRMTLVCLERFAYLQVSQSFILSAPIQKFLPWAFDCSTLTFHCVSKTRCVPPVSSPTIQTVPCRYPQPAANHEIHFALWDALQRHKSDAVPRKHAKNHLCWCG